MFFLALLLKVSPLQKGTVHTECAPFCTHVYNTLFHVLAQTDEARGIQTHRLEMHTNITVALLQSKAGQEQVRVTMYGQHAPSAIHVLLSALAEQPVLRCEHQSYQVLSVDLAHAPFGSISTWVDLLVPSSSPSLRLHFVTPTIFAGTTADSMQREMFPQPLHVFAALLDKWNHLEGPTLAHEVIPWLESSGCVVSDYQLQAEPIAVHTGTGSVIVFPGWKGWITYTCRKPQTAWMSSLRALARLACFTGVGDCTEVGLGVTQIVENREANRWNGA